MTTSSSNTNQEPLILERTFNASIARVWKAFTDGNDFKQWHPFIASFKAEVGFEFSFMLGPDDEHQFKHLCKVTEVVDGKKLAFSWRYEGYEGDSLLTYELFKEADDKTRVKLTWSGTDSFPPQFEAKGFKMGSEYTMKALQELVETAA